MARKKATASTPPAESYEHPQSKLPMRPDVGTQAQFKKKKPPATYRYDSSLAPEMQWDGQNSARERGEALVAEIAAQTDALRSADDDEKRDRAIAALEAAAAELKALSRAFLNWSGKAERTSFDVPTLPLFVHERLSTKAIIETLAGHRRSRETQASLFELFGDPEHPIADQVLKAYEYRDNWTNRMILGDSLIVMNSLLHYENLGGQVQMIYIDPPYGVKFGSNFQPFVRKRDVKHGDDEDMSREPEMVQAYRDTWELGLHSYLTYMRDRLLLARELLTPSGSIFVQISDENLHHVRELMDEVFGAENSVVTIIVKKKGGQKSTLVDPINDFALWYAKDKTRCRDRFHNLFAKLDLSNELVSTFRYVELPDGRELTLKDLTKQVAGEPDYVSSPRLVHRDFPGARFFASENLTSGGFRTNQSVIFEFRGRRFDPGIARGNCWKHTAKTEPGAQSGLDRLATASRLFVSENQLRYKRYLEDFGFSAVTNLWDDVAGAANPQYVVQTSVEVIKRCLLMTTEPGDLVVDPTCGSGTTAYVAEQWGRRWITADVSRVPLALARQRLLTATFPWYQLKDDSGGPAGGFVYKRKQNKKGEEVGGIVPHIMSSSIANNEPPKEEVLVDRPETVSGITRVTGKFCVEGTIPTPVDWDGDAKKDGPLPKGEGDAQATVGTGESQATFEERMIEILRKSPLLRLDGGRTVALRNIRPPAKSLSLSAEAIVDASATGKANLTDLVEEAVEKNSNLLPLSQQVVAFVFGPENGAVSEKLVFAAAREAMAKSYAHLYVIGFAIQPNARSLIESCEAVVGIPSTYVQATPDLLMGDLLKNMRSSQIFSVCGLPEVKVYKLKGGECQVELLGVDVFDPVTMEVDSRKGDDVPCWLLDADYNDLCFHVSQAFFPRTGAWDNLKKALKGEYDETVWDHLAGAKSAPFEPGEHRKIAVKVIDDRGNELMVVKPLNGARK